MKKYTNILPSDVIVLLKVGEETANLQQAAKNAILLYEEEFNKIVDNLSKIVEPILIVIVG
jgi:type IV pilus assembly protein PilC